MAVALGILSFLLAVAAVVIFFLWRALVRTYFYWMDAEEELERLRCAPPVDILIGEGTAVTRVWMN